jgi:excisionase family DNA binding protein
MTSESQLPPDLADVAKSLPPLLTLREAAEVLRLNERTLRKLIADGVIRARRNVPRGSSRVIVTRYAVIEYLLRREVA